MENLIDLAAKCQIFEFTFFRWSPKWIVSHFKMAVTWFFWHLVDWSILDVLLVIQVLLCQIHSRIRLWHKLNYGKAFNQDLEIITYRFNQTVVNILNAIRPILKNMKLEKFMFCQSILTKRLLVFTWKESKEWLQKSKRWFVCCHSQSENSLCNHQKWNWQVFQKTNLNILACL